MKKLTILVDMDEVLDNLLEAWVSYLNKRHNTNANMENKETWSLKGLYPSLTEDEIDQPLYDNDFWKTLTPKPYSVEYLHRMIRDGHEVYIVTATHIYQTLPAKIDWLFLNYPYLAWESIITTNKKQIVMGDVLIDDAVHNLEGGNYIKMLYDCPHNRKYDAEGNGMIRVYNLMDAYDVISTLARGG